MFAFIFQVSKRLIGKTNFQDVTVVFLVEGPTTGGGGGGGRGHQHEMCACALLLTFYLFTHTHTQTHM